jgi:hypothetical protein
MRFIKKIISFKIDSIMDIENENKTPIIRLRQYAV